jgi:DNA-binding transcriptional ArsR family regulator
LRLVELLATEDELCGMEIATKAGISMALLSHHWRVLSEAGIVTKTRRGQRQYCVLNRDVLAIAFENLWPNRRLSSPLV